MAHTAHVLQGIRVKHRLLDLGKRQTWLIEEMKKREPDKYIDSGYMARILNGTEISAPKMKLIDEILTEEEERQNGANGMGQED